MSSLIDSSFILNLNHSDGGRSANISSVTLSPFFKPLALIISLPTIEDFRELRVAKETIDNS